MAKIKHPNVVDMIDANISHGVSKNILHLSTDKVLGGRKVIINDKELLHFGNCNYLGLEQHPQVKEAAIRAIRDEGIRLTMSRTYVSSGYYGKLEALLSEIFDGHAVVAPSSTMLHLSAIPVLVGRRDAVILDHQVHASMRQAVQYIKPLGVLVENIRHSDFEMLENSIKRLYKKHEKIWYVLDGVYSMYGDAPDIHKLIALLDKYPKLHLYVDDAHGTSWIGQYGRGYVLNQVPLHERMMLTISLGKGFGVIGGVLISKNEEPCRRVRTCGGTLIFSAPLSSGLLGAAVESAKIHLTKELVVMQNDLQEKIIYCNQLIREAKLPSIREENTPIFYIALGQPKATYNMLERLINSGFLVNMGAFPAVAHKCAGIRFLLTCHLKKEDIYWLIQAIKYHLPQVMAESNVTFDNLATAFELPKLKELAPFYDNKIELSLSKPPQLRIEEYHTIHDVDEAIWEKTVANIGPFSKACLAAYEEVFQKNEKEENNWKFSYFLVKDLQDKVVLATFFTQALWKDDVFSPPSVSKDADEQRKIEPHFLTSTSLAMGSQCSEGKPLFLDINNPEWKEAIDKLLQTLWKKQSDEDIELLVFRDIDIVDTSLSTYLIDKGFMKVIMPETHNVKNLNTHATFNDYVQALSANSRRHIRKNAIRHEEEVEEIQLNQVSQRELEHLYNLYLQVKKVNYSINTFELPIAFFQKMIQDPSFIVWALYSKADKNEDRLPIGFYCATHNAKTSYYYPLFLGIDYDYLHTYAIYRQVLYRVVKHAYNLKCDSVHLGFTADIEKQKLGTVSSGKAAFLQYKDNYKLEILESMSVTQLEKHY
ncbi:MAG: aminotransferase class I/II-fold pyridoxal phosphate-dependent enzyme [Chitinophagales bacterium]